METVDEIATVPLDKLAHAIDANLASPDFLKIDTQGYEGQVLDGAGELVGKLAAISLELSFVALYDTRHTYLRVWEAVVLGVVVVLAAVVGDLFESMLKRDMQVKDTGSLLGGHGGILDPVDALLFAGPAAYYLVLGLGHA